MGPWALVKHFVPSVADCLVNFGSVQPKHRDAFKRRYEADGNLSVDAQSQRLGCLWGYGRVEPPTGPLGRKAKVDLFAQCSRSTGERGECKASVVLI